MPSSWYDVLPVAPAIKAEARALGLIRLKYGVPVERTFLTLRGRLLRLRRMVRGLRHNGGRARRGAFRRALHEIDRDLLPRIRRAEDPIALILPTSTEWMGWEAMTIVDTDEEFSEHVHDLVRARCDGALLLLLGMLGPHFRQQSDEVDRSIFPVLLVVALRHLRVALCRGQVPRARRLAGIIFNALHFNPDYSLARDRARQRKPYDLEVYRRWLGKCLRELRRRRVEDLPALVERAARRFPRLLGKPGGPLPLALQFADKSKHYMEQSGQHILELLAQHVEEHRPVRCPTVWDLVSGDAHPVVQEFMASRNHRIPPFQLDLLTRIRDGIIAGTLFEGLSDE